MKIFFILFFVVGSVYASIGKVTEVLGDIYVIRDLKSTKIEKGFNIKNKDVFLSQPKSKVEVTFIDNTVISIGQKSSFLIEEYIYDENNKENSKCSLKFSKGSFKSVTGKIGKIGQDKFQLKTQNANISVKGTTVLAYQLVNEQGQMITVQVTTEGTTGITGASGAEQLVGAGKVSVVVEYGAASVAVEATPELINAISTATNVLSPVTPNLASFSIQNNVLTSSLAANQAATLGGITVGTGTAIAAGVLTAIFTGLSEGSTSTHSHH